MYKLAPLPRHLEAALRDTAASKVDVRRSAVRDLGRLAASEAARPAAIAELSRLLRHDADADVRADAALALADADAREQLASLVEAAEDAHARVRQMVLVALGELGTAGDERTLGVIERALDDQAPALRYQALIALDRLRGVAATEAVATATRDPDPQVRYIALRILDERWVEEGKDIPASAAVRVRALLRDERSEVRLAAAILLARLGDPAGSNEIVAAVNGRSRGVEFEDEQAAVKLAGQLRLAEARPGLERRALGWFGISLDPCAYQARVALARLGDPRAIEAIVRGLRAWSRDARTLAVAAAGEAGLEQTRTIIEAMRGDVRSAEPHAVEEALVRLDGARSESTAGHDR